MVLKKCEMFSQVIEKTKEIPSHYGTLDFINLIRHQNASHNLEQKSFDMVDNHSILLNPINKSFEGNVSDD